MMIGTQISKNSEILLYRKENASAEKINYTVSNAFLSAGPGRVQIVAASHKGRMPAFTSYSSRFGSVLS